MSCCSTSLILMEARLLWHTRGGGGVGLLLVNLRQDLAANVIWFWRQRPIYLTGKVLLRERDMNVLSYRKEKEQQNWTVFKCVSSLWNVSATQSCRQMVVWQKICPPKTRPRKVHFNFVCLHIPHLKSELSRYVAGESLNWCFWKRHKWRHK